MMLKVRVDVHTVEVCTKIIYNNVYTCDEPTKKIEVVSVQKMIMLSCVRVAHANLLSLTLETASV